MYSFFKSSKRLDSCISLIKKSLFQRGKWHRTSPLHTSLWLQWLLCMTVALNWLISLRVLLIWHQLTIFCSPTWKKKLSWWNRTPFVIFPGASQNVSSTTLQSPELLIQCRFIWNETMQLVSGKVELNAWQVSLLWHNSFLVSLWTFQPTLVWLIPWLMQTDADEELDLDQEINYELTQHKKFVLPPSWHSLQCTLTISIIL